MGRRGPAPTPTAILRARGSWRAKKRKREPAPLLEAPECPTWLVREAKAEWKRQLIHLEKMGLLAKVDRAVLSAYCEAWSEFVRLAGRCHRLGDVRAIALGLFKAKNAASDRMTRLAQQFGFSPSARARLQTDGPKETPAANSKKRFFGSAS